MRYLTLDNPDTGLLVTATVTGATQPNYDARRAFYLQVTDRTTQECRLQALACPSLFLPASKIPTHTHPPRLAAFV